MNFMNFNVKIQWGFHEIHEFHEICANFMKFMLVPYLSFKPKQVGMLISYYHQWLCVLIAAKGHDTAS